MASQLNNWPIGEKHVLLESILYNLKVYITREEHKKIRKYNTFVDMFTLKFTKIDENKTLIGLSFERINLIQNVVESFYNKVMDYYKNDIPNNKLKFQLDLYLDGLKLKYIKSGVFSSSTNFGDISKILLSQLMSAHRSDESLEMNTSLQLYLTVTDIDLTPPNFKPFGITTSNCALAKNLKQSNFIASNEFFKYIKIGYLDLTQVDRNLNSMNCILINTSFANYMYTNKLKILDALVKFTSPDKIEMNRYTQMNNVNDLSNFNKLEFNACIDYLSKQINRVIVIISKSTKMNCLHEIVYISKNKNRFELRKKIPIYLLLERNKNLQNRTNLWHVSFAFNFKLKQNSNFCFLCIRNVSKGYHRCKLLKCRLCKRYMSNQIDEYTTDNCNSKNKLDCNVTCKICNNKFMNKECYNTHIKLKGKRKFCLQYYKCNVCDLFVKNGENIHKHNNRFCLTCKIYHSIHDTCYMSPKHFNKRKKSNKYFFLKIAFTNEGNPMFAMITEINKTEKLNENYNIIYLNENYVGNDFDKLIFSTKDNLSLETIIGYFKGIKYSIKSTVNIEIFSDSTTIKYLLKYINSQTTEIIYGRNCVSGFKLKQIFFKCLDSFIDLKSHNLAFLLNKNMAQVIVPQILTEEKIVNNSYIKVNKTDYDIDVYIGSSRKQYECLKSDINNITAVSDYAGKVFISISKFTFDIYMSSIFKLIDMYNSIKINLSVNKVSFMFEHNSLAQSGNYLFRCLLKEKELPIIDEDLKHNIKNSSRIEYATCEILTLLHTMTCKQETKFSSLINNSGRQYKINNYTADFKCSVCNIVYFINGSYKVVECNYGHRQNLKNTFFGKNKYEMALKFNKNLKQMLSLTSDIQTPIIFNQCCIMSKQKSAIKIHILKQLRKYKIKNSIDITKQLMYTYHKLILNYTKEHYLGINYRECVDPALVTYITPYFNISDHNGESICQKYDMISAFPEQLKDILLPYRDNGTKYVFKQANNYFNNLLTSGMQNKVTGFCRAKVTPTLNKFTKICPFFGYKCQVTNEYTLTLCKKCCIKKLQSITCTHNDEERSFYVNSTIASLAFAKMNLNYKVEITELFVYESCKNYSEFTQVFNEIENLRKDNAFYKHFGKSMYLQALGSFSLNLKNYNDYKSVSNYSTLASTISDTKSGLKSYNFFGDTEKSPHCMIELKNKNSFKKIKSPKINTLIYTSCSNRARIKLYETMMQIILKHTDSQIIRLDSDALTISYLKNCKKSIEDIFTKQNFKLELCEISTVVSFKRRSYLIINRNSDFNQLKTCGLSLPLNVRFYSLDYSKLVGDYFEKKDNNNSKSRIIEDKLIKSDFYDYIQSYPFGIN